MMLSNSRLFTLLFASTLTLSGMSYAQQAAPSSGQARYSVVENFALDAARLGSGPVQFTLCVSNGDESIFDIHTPGYTPSVEQVASDTFMVGTYNARFYLGQNRYENYVDAESLSREHGYADPQKFSCHSENYDSLASLDNRFLSLQMVETNVAWRTYTLEVSSPNGLSTQKTYRLGPGRSGRAAGSSSVSLMEIHFTQYQ